MVALIATQLFSNGYPLGIDTFSHLPKVFHLAEFGISSWYFDWYGGYPLFLFYPPLGYILAYLTVLTGLEVLFAYKIVELLFLLATPVVFYFFAKRSKLTRGQTIYATLIFSIMPFTIQNSVVFGRFTNILGYPFFIAAILFLQDMIKTHSRRSLVLTAVFFSLTLLTHHLSGYLLAIIMLIYGVGVLFESDSARRRLKSIITLGGSLSLGIALSSFWVIPFLLLIRYYSFVGSNSSTIGGAPFALSILVIVVFLMQWSLRKAYPKLDSIERSILAWMIIFITLGSTLIPVQYVLPFAPEIDIMRFQLYFVVPFSIYVVTLSKYQPGFLRKALKLRAILQKAQAWVVVLILLNAVTGIYILHSYPTVVAQQIYVDEPPESIVKYLKGSNAYGRILPIDVPYWVYVLPHMTNKPLIDGWYPQGSVIGPVKEVGKPIDSINNDNIYSFFISHASNLGVKWVLLGNSSRAVLLKDSSFHPVVSAGQYILYENLEKTEYVTTLPPVQTGWAQGKCSVTIIMSLAVSRA
jgi:uncharacterized membrane protein